MKYLRLLPLLLLLPGCSFKPAKEISLDSDQALFAQTWVSDLNEKRYDKAWDVTTDEFRDNLPFDKWAEAEDSARNFIPKLDSTQVKQAYTFSKWEEHNISGTFCGVEVITESNVGERWHDLVMLVKRNGQWWVIGHNPWKNEGPNQLESTGAPPAAQAPETHP